MSLKRYLLPTTLMLAIAMLALVVAPDVLAVETGLEKAATGASIPVGGDIKETVGRVLKTLLGFVGTLFLVLMVYAGFLYMTARGDSKKVDTAKQLIVGAIIGIVIIGGAYSITNFVLDQASGTETKSPTAPAEPGSVKLGGTCATTADCGDSNVCYPDFHVCGIANMGSDGTPCTEDNQCEAGLVCGQANQVCEVFQPGTVPDGGKCAQSSDCVNQELCQGGTCTYIEWDSVPIGGECRVEAPGDTYSTQCQGWNENNTRCIDSKCVAAAKREGEVCDINGGDDQCEPPSHCAMIERSYCEASGRSLCANDEACGADGPCIPSLWKCAGPSKKPSGDACTESAECESDQCIYERSWCDQRPSKACSDDSVCGADGPCHPRPATGTCL